jgi:hypothetical protein
LFGDDFGGDADAVSAAHAGAAEFHDEEVLHGFGSEVIF